MKTEFGAPWGRSLIWISVLATALLLGVGLIVPWFTRELAPPWVEPMLWLPLVIAPCALPFVVRGYVVAGGEIRVRRLWWETRLSGTPVSARVDAEAMKGSVRTFGNGGLYSFTGRYWSRKQGSYRAFVTDPKRCVVVEYAGAMVVVSPDDPEGFVAAVGSGEAAANGEADAKKTTP